MLTMQKQILCYMYTQGIAGLRYCGCLSFSVSEVSSVFSVIVLGFVELQTDFGLLSNSVFILRPRSRMLRK